MIGTPFHVSPHRDLRAAFRLKGQDKIGGASREDAGEGVDKDSASEGRVGDKSVGAITWIE